VSAKDKSERALAARTNAASAAGAMDLVTILIDAAKYVYDAKQGIAREQAHRAEIAEATRVEVERIRATKSLLMTYLERTFDERKALFEALLARLDGALDGGDADAVSAVLQATLDLAKSSPFKQLQDAGTFQQALRDKSTEWRF
jgi:hypothetical protein